MKENLLGPRIVAWEITRSCNLYCAHCRAAAENSSYLGELSTQECLSVVDQLCQLGKPMLILTGGEPLLRQDFFEIAEYAAGKGLRVTVGSNGTILTKETAAAMKRVPISRVAISLDFPIRELQDQFRRMPGAFDFAIRGARNALEAGVPIQINATITKLNAPHLEALLHLALELGATAFHPFLLVPTGRGKNLKDEELLPVEYERILRWICEKQADLGDKMFFKPTDAPHYMRVKSQCGVDGPIHHHSADATGHGGQVRTSSGMNGMTRGCLAGSGFCFISHVGRVQGCGYLDIEAGDLKKQSFKNAWYDSQLFKNIRNLSLLKGKCGVCEYKEVCGGCRARAYETTGDYLAAEPYCVYRPKANGIGGEASKTEAI